MPVEMSSVDPNRDNSIAPAAQKNNLHDLTIIYRAIIDLKPSPRNARAHSKKQIRQTANSIRSFGFINPVLIDGNDTIVAGHCRVQAARLLGFDTIPVIRLLHLTEVEKRAYALADNKLALNASWNLDLLAAEVQYLLESEFEVETTGFAIAEIDIVLEEAAERDGQKHDPEDVVPVHDRSAPATSQPGDRWILGNHVLLCADALDPSSYIRLLQNAKAGMVFTDPPYNVPIEGHVSGRGRVQHREFAMASGEMPPGQFEKLLQTTLLRV
jgi:hypothetical protein